MRFVKCLGMNVLWITWFCQITADTWPKLVDVMNSIRKTNSYTTSFTYFLAMILFLVED